MMTWEPSTGASRIDWAVARERLDLLARAVAGEMERTPEQTRQVLESRARTLAKPLSTGPAQESIEVLGFTISGERYAIESRFVFAVFRLEHLTLVPAADPPLVGLTAWRGELLTLLDLRVVTGTSAAVLSDLAWVAVIGDESAAFGILVDDLPVITRLTRSEIGPVPAGLTGTRQYMRGITREAILVLDAVELIRIHT